MTQTQEQTRGLTWTSRFCTGADPYAGITWVEKDAAVYKSDGSIVFLQKDVEVPDTWSDLAISQVADKYLRGKLNDDGTPAPGRETSVRQLIDRVVDTMAGWAGYTLGDDEEAPEGWKKIDTVSFGMLTHKRPKQSVQRSQEVYFDSRVSWEAWQNDLKWLLVRQYVAFNSPVWFNVGIDSYPQCAACFLLEMEDWILGKGDGDSATVIEAEDIMEHHGLAAAQVKETLIFSNGSGSGINLSRVRSTEEWLSGGGRPSGPISFADGLDAWAAVIKSGGKTRRAAKMLIMDADHPDIERFVDVKSKEGLIAEALKNAGYGGHMESEALSHARHQNSNLSVRTTDSFMKAVDERADWDLISRSHHFLEDHPTKTSMIGVEGRVIRSIKAYDLMDRIALRAWECADPGMLFHTTINKWNTCLDEEPITTCNPCAEYHFLVETSCNLASLNLKRFLKIIRDNDGTILNIEFDVTAFRHAIEAVTIAMDVEVANAKYPTANIRDRTVRYRTLGLGYANVGGMLMEMGLPYNSTEAREVIGLITSLMTASVYEQSARMAANLGAFEAYYLNKDSCLRVMKQHYDAHTELEYQVDEKHWTYNAHTAADMLWERVVQACETGKGLRNAQASVLAPTGTIAFFMDCETTGIEPELALVKWKVLAGGGTLPIFTKVDGYLKNLGYTEEEVVIIHEHLRDGKSIRKCPTLKEEHHEIFKTSFQPADGDDFYLPWEAHIEMMAAAQPFISGAISKTVNLPESATQEEILGIYMLAWHAGLKAVSIYRDNSKPLQAVATHRQDDGSSTEDDETAREELESKLAVLEERLLEIEGKQGRKKLNRNVIGGRTKMSIDGNKGFIHVGFFPDTWKIAEIFMRLSKQGSTMDGMMDAICKAYSKLLQYGLEIDEMIEDLEFTQFPPYGPVMADPDVRTCLSPLDYLAKKIKAVRERVHDPVSLLKTFADIDLDMEPIELPEHVDETPIIRKLGRSCPRCGCSPIIVERNCIKCDFCGYDEGGCFA